MELESAILSIIGFGMLILLFVSWWNPRRRLNELQVTMQNRSKRQHTDEIVRRVLRIVSGVATDATGITMVPEAMRLEDRLSTDLLLDLDSLSMHHLQSALSREFGISFDFQMAAKTHHYPLNYLAEPTIKMIVEMVEKQMKEQGKDGFA